MTQESAPQKSPGSAKWLLRYLRHGHYLGIGVVLAIFFVMLFASVGLDFGRLGSPGPGLWPISISILGIALSGLSLGAKKQIPQTLTKDAAMRVLVAILSIILVPAVYGYTGFVPAATVAMIVMFRLVGRESWLLSIPLSLVAALFIHGVFGVALDIPLQGWSF